MRTEPVARLVLAGYGDIGARVARQAPADTLILGINRRGRQAQPLPRLPQVQALDLADLGPLLQPSDVLLWLAPPPSEGADDPALAAALQACSGLRKLVYLSTSGVYGDCAGSWVDEDHVPAPQTARAQRRFAAEQCVQQWAMRYQVPWAIVRVPGIYGPGRLPIQRLKQRLPTLASGLAPWSNRIHADDLAAFLSLVLAAGSGIYNVSDGQPSTITAYFHAAADVLQQPRLPEVEAVDALTPELASYMRESRRLDIGRARALGFAPRWPDFRQALPHCVQPDLDWCPSSGADS